MLAIASQIILCLVLAALLGLIIGYLLGKGNCPKAAYKAVTPVDPHTHDDEVCEEEEEESASDVPEEAAEAEIAREPQGLLDTQSSKDQESEKIKDQPQSDAGSATQEANDSEITQKTDATTASSATVSDVTDTQGADTQATTAKEETSEPDTQDAKNVSNDAQEEAPSDDDKPAMLLDAPRNGQKDNLTRIKGIGVKIDALLNGIGVYHFNQIAAWSEKEARWIDHQVSFPGRALRDDWIGQAKLLAEGKETEFSKRVDAGEVSSSKKS